MRLLLHVCFAAAVVGFNPAFAQYAMEPEQTGAAADATLISSAAESPPARVGRVSFVSGNVELRSPGAAGWANAEPNWPVSTGEALRTAPRSRAEIEIGATTIALSDGSEMEISSLRDQVTQITLSRGRIGVHLRETDEDEPVEVHVPQGEVWLLASGTYDIESGTSEQITRVAAFDGKARFVAGKSDIEIAAGRNVILKDQDTNAAIVEATAPDAFVAWCREHDYDESSLAAPYYISPHMTGFAALDAAGTWKTNPDYGPLWFPTTSEDWAPYRFGHWRWIASWGWTWIDDQSWGFAPSHYGRWVLIDNRWAWAPGSFSEHPLYAPAVVAFLGTPGVGLSSEGGATVAWFPLAPGEAYWPSYARNVDYVRDLNRANVENVGKIAMSADGEPPMEIFDEDFANRQYASIVPRSVFINGRPVAGALVTLPEQRLLDAPVLMASPQLAPASAQPIARVVTPAVIAPTVRVAARESKSGGKLIRTAVVQPRSRGGTAIVIRGAHLRAPSFAGSTHERQLIVLHVAQPRGARRAHG